MTRTFAAVIALASFGLGACQATVDSEPTTQAAGDARGLTQIVVVGTNDLHGALQPEQQRRGAENFAGYLDLVRATHPGRVILLDAGDLWQGSAESNLSEGRAVVTLYRELGYSAVAIGNHEFDFGPVGPDTSARGADPQGALKERAREAQGVFPFLSANIIDRTTNAEVRWQNVKPSHVVRVADTPVGIIGATTTETQHTTIRANLKGLRFVDPAQAVNRQARALRASGTRVILVVAHLGGDCSGAFGASGHFDPHDTGICDPAAEVMRFAHALEPGLVDGIVAGHSHELMAHFVAGIPVIESGSRGRFFGRMDLFVETRTGRADPDATVLHPPTQVCPACAPYEGKTVRPSARIADVVRPYVESARAQCGQAFTHLSKPLRRNPTGESRLGNLIADAMRAAVPGAHAAVQNGGGIRADLPEGAITHCDVLSVLPFENSLVAARMTGEQLRLLVRILTSGAHGIARVSGLELHLDARTAPRPEHDLDGDGRTEAWEVNRLLDIALVGGTPLVPEHEYTVVINDFIAQGGDNTDFVMQQVPVERRIEFRDRGLRDLFVSFLARHGAKKTANEPRLQFVNAGER